MRTTMIAALLVANAWACSKDAPPATADQTATADAAPMVTDVAPSASASAADVAAADAAVAATVDASNVALVAAVDGGAKKRGDGTVMVTGGLIGDVTDPETTGLGGLGISGTMDGGGEGIGLGNLGTFRRADGGSYGSGAGFGNGHGHLGGHRSSGSSTGGQ